jgi:hypothetical protein
MASIDPYVGVNIQGQTLQNAAARRQLQGQNMLRQVLSQPGAVDTQGKISPNALRQIMQADAVTALGLLQQQTQLQDAQSLRAYRQSETVREQRKDDLAEISEATAVYNQEVGSGTTSPDIAREHMQTRLQDYAKTRSGSQQDNDNWYKQASSMSPGALQVMAQAGEAQGAQAEPTFGTMVTPEGRVPVLVQGGTVMDPNTRQPMKVTGPIERETTGFDPGAAEAKAKIGAEYRQPKMYESPDKHLISRNADGTWFDETDQKEIASPPPGTRGVESGRQYSPQMQIFNDWKDGYAQANGHPPSADEEQRFYGGTLAAASMGRVTGQRAAQINMAANEVDNFAKLADDAYDKAQASGVFKRVPLKIVNQLINAGETQASDPDLQNLLIQINGLVNARAAAISRTGQIHVYDQQAGRGLISADLDPAAFHAAVDGFKAETQGVRDSVSQAATQEGIAVPGTGVKAPGAAPTPQRRITATGPGGRKIEYRDGAWHDMKTGEVVR